MLVPGPNVLAYYFAFRMVGHFFSLRGARQGLEGWPGATKRARRSQICDARSHVGPDVREDRVRDVADRLRLEHLAAFFGRAAEPSSSNAS